MSSILWQGSYSVEPHIRRKWRICGRNSQAEREELGPLQQLRYDIKQLWSSMQKLKDDNSTSTKKASASTKLMDLWSTENKMLKASAESFTARNVDLQKSLDQYKADVEVLTRDA
ncbi:hypothetical protein VTL71DRAFT_8694 [Oculimacula yallundae]|uniref:Uncharacterized protein n=1 Tax=Oculimacula yallundae TaxID=86028 RepID=A0ABR4D0R2_9HELO